MQCEAICKNGTQCKHKRKFDKYCGHHKECPVCYRNTRLVAFSCKHEICANCSEKWLKNNTTCPLCRAVVSEAPEELSLEMQFQRRFTSVPGLEQRTYTELILMLMVLDPGANMEDRVPVIDMDRLLALNRMIYAEP
jgi:hypothetical protein